MRVLLVIGLQLVGSGCTSGNNSKAGTSTTTSSATPMTAPVPGSLASATTAVRSACREFYTHDPSNTDASLTNDELAAECDARAIEWRSDCHAERPAEFAPRDGGCAYLGGYLAVWYGQQAFAEGRLFKAGDDVWTVIPESD